MRKQIDGLAALVRDGLECNPLDGSLYLFAGKGGRRLKILYWDRNGFCLWQKRLEADRFPWPRESGAARNITAGQLTLLLDGNALSKHDGLSPVYAVSGPTVSADLSKNGWRLPTEAEYQYATSRSLISLPPGKLEWCQDWFGNYPEGAVTNPAGNPDGIRRLLRGGPEAENPVQVDTSLRTSFFPDMKDPSWTFRIVRRQ